MQYHNMLKQKHELEQKAAAETAAKKKEIEQRVNAAKKEMEKPKETKEEAAERVAKELLEAEEREKDSKNGFSGVKKGFLEQKKKK